MKFVKKVLFTVIVSSMFIITYLIGKMHGAKKEKVKHIDIEMCLLTSINGYMRCSLHLIDAIENRDNDSIFKAEFKKAYAREEDAKVNLNNALKLINHANNRQATAH